MKQATPILLPVFLEGSWASQSQLKSGVVSIATDSPLKEARSLMFN